MVTDETASNASRYVSKAIDRGINYFDVAPEYGNAQEMLGPALRPYRKDVFLACKTRLNATAKGAEREFKDSLKKLKTDYFDLLSNYARATKRLMKSRKQIPGPGGALQYFIEAKKRDVECIWNLPLVSERSSYCAEWTRVVLPGIYFFI
ncbi:MAG: aldo/keto reductase [Actinomycetota bacterium]|nr:aldo/keto reductase [Actinomycetota bacterium]